VPYNLLHVPICTQLNARFLIDSNSCNVNGTQELQCESELRQILRELSQLDPDNVVAQLGILFTVGLSNFKYQIFQRFQIPNFVFSCIWQHDRRKECTNNCRKFIGRTFVA